MNGVSPQQRRWLRRVAVAVGVVAAVTVTAVVGLAAFFALAMSSYGSSK